MKNNIKLILIIFFAAFFLNLFWENLHSLLYDWDKFPLQNNVYFYVYKILKSTFIDAIFISLIFLLNSLFRKNFQWIKNVEKRDYIVFVVFGLIFSFIIEIKAKILNMWSYNEYMPLIFGIGFTPLIQLAITAVIALFIIKNYFKN